MERLTRGRFRSAAQDAAVKPESFPGRSSKRLKSSASICSAEPKRSASTNGSKLARALELVLLRTVRRLRRCDGRSAADRGRKLRNLRAALGAADLLELLEILLRPRGRAHLDHRLALDGNGVGVVRFDQQRLARSCAWPCRKDAASRQRGRGRHKAQRLRGSTASAVSNAFSASSSLPAAISAWPWCISSTDLRLDLIVGALACDRAPQAQSRQSRRAEDEARTASNSPLPCSPPSMDGEPRDEKAVGTVMAGSQQPPCPVRTPGRQWPYPH